ncbi:MAG: BtpA/SgcQ family protein [Thermomicrobiales bacterium]
MHLHPLPGTAKGGDASSLAEILDAARRDAAAYTTGGVEAIIVENFGDAPFRRGPVEPHVIAAMTKAVEAVASESGLPIGVNILRNDVTGAVSIAAMAGARFVRANVYVGAAVTDQGIIQGEAEEVQSLIRGLRADVDIWADVDVKHAVQLAQRPVAELAADAIERGLAAAVIVTGPATGMPADEQDLASVKSAVLDAMVMVGSGVRVDNLHAVFRHADGVIVGTSMKVDGVVTNAVDVERVRALVTAARSI